MSLADNLVDDTWLDSFDYDIKYNDKNFLSIELNSEGSAAYPSSWTKWVNVDTRTGEILLIDDLFSEDKQLELIKLINEKMIENEKAAIAENPDVKEALEDQRGSYGDEIQPKAGTLRVFKYQRFLPNTGKRCLRLRIRFSSRDPCTGAQRRVFVHVQRNKTIRKVRQFA